MPTYSSLQRFSPVEAVRHEVKFMVTAALEAATGNACGREPRSMPRGFAFCLLKTLSPARRSVDGIRR